MITCHGFYTVTRRILTLELRKSASGLHLNKQPNDKKQLYIPKNLLALHLQGPYGSASTVTIVIKKHGALILHHRSILSRYAGI